MHILLHCGMPCFGQAAYVIMSVSANTRTPLFAACRTNSAGVNIPSETVECACRSIMCGFEKSRSYQSIYALQLVLNHSKIAHSAKALFAVCFS